MLSLFFAASVLLAPSPAIERALNRTTVSAAVVSPDGAWVAYTEQSADWEQNAFVTQLWVAWRSDGARRQLTRGKDSVRGIAWSPDSRRAGFLRKGHEGKTQVWAIAPDGGEAEAITKHGASIDGFAWSSKGALAFLAAEPESKEDKERKEKYGEYQVVERDYTLSHLWIQPADAKEAARLTDGKQHVSDLAWSPDGRRIAFPGAPDPDLSHGDRTELYVAEVEAKTVRVLAGGPGREMNPVWSPDGATVAYQWSGPEPDGYHMNQQVLLTGIEAGAKPKRVLADFDENAGLSAWCASGLYFRAQQRTAAGLFRLNVTTGAVSRVTTEPFAMQGGSFSRDCAVTAFAAAMPNEAPEIWAAPTGAPAEKLTQQTASAAPGAVRETIRWKSQDGTEIEGVLIKPRNFDAAKKYPLLVVIHGGPTGVDTPAAMPDRYYPIESFVAKGALVLRPNYRGSAGYGEKFRSLNVRNLGVGDAWDVISGVDHLIAQGSVDRSRVGAMGWSQGGYISAFLTCSSDRFRAISVGAGISDWMTYYVNTDIHPFTRMYLKATPWDDPEIYRKTSPISYVKSARTPTLIQHGELDRRVPVPNAYELYQALQDKGVESRLVIYKGFGHGIDKPKQQRHLMEDNEAWFDKYLFDGK